MGRANTRTCLEKALELLALRAHFSRELEIKLQRRGYGAQEIEAALERLRELGMIDDPRTAATYVETRTQRAPAGRRLLQAELRRRGVAAAQTQEALGEVDEPALARDAAERFLRRRSRPGEDAQRRLAALARHLGSRGFGGAAIARVLEEQAGGEELAFAEDDGDEDALEGGEDDRG